MYKSESNLKIPHAKIAIITSQFNGDISNNLKKACVKTLIKYGVLEENITEVDVPGALEIPLAAKYVIQKHKVHAVIALGCIIKGDTYHFELVADNSARGCQDISLQYSIPVINEILPCYSLKDAKDRSGNNKYNRGISAAITALEMTDLISNLT